MPLKYMTAKKARVCSLCQRAIPVGTSYWERTKLGKPKTLEHKDCTAFAHLPVIADTAVIK